MPNNIAFDAIVVGAGAAGLAASRRLAEAGCSVLLLEARDRVGGRIWSLDGPTELGAEFIHGRPSATLDLLREGGIRSVAVSGDHWEREGDHFAPMRDRLEGVHRLLDPAAKLTADSSVEEYLVSAVSAESAAAASAGIVRRLVEQFDAADPIRASVQAIVGEWSGDATVESPQARPDGSYAPVIDLMVAALDRGRVKLRVEAAVREIHWSADSVEVVIEHRGEIQRARARRAIITLPLGVLQAGPGQSGHVQFVPPLEAKQSALAGLAMGPALKVLLRYRTRFWETIDAGRYLEASFFHWDQAPFRTVWTGRPGQSPWLSAWLGGPRAAQLAAEPDQVIALRAAESVQWMFRGLADLSGELVETRLHNWQRDPWALGAYSYVTVGGAAARADLARPLADALYFAGEATEAGGEASTVAGAIMSGQRAAAEILTARGAP